MTAEVVNLRQMRKMKSRAAHAAAGAANRATFGRSRQDRKQAAHVRDIASRQLDGHRLEEIDGDGASTGPGDGNAA